MLFPYLLIFLVSLTFYFSIYHINFHCGFFCIFISIYIFVSISYLVILFVVITIACFTVFSICFEFLHFLFWVSLWLLLLQCDSKKSCKQKFKIFEDWKNWKTHFVIFIKLSVCVNLIYHYLELITFWVIINDLVGRVLKRSALIYVLLQFVITVALCYKILKAFCNKLLSRFVIN